MLTPNPYQSPHVEEPLWAEIIDDTPDPSRPVWKTVAGVAFTIGAVMGGDAVVKNDLARLALLAAATAGLGYSATLSDTKSPSAS